MNKLYITLISLLIILVFLYFSGIVSFYSQTIANTNFNGATSLIAFDSNGNLKTVPVANINAGINSAVQGTADSLAKQTTDLEKNRVDPLSNGLSYIRNRLPNLAIKSAVDSRFQQQDTRLRMQDERQQKMANNYVKKNENIRIFNNDNNQILLKWDHNISSDGNINGKENYRYFRIKD